MLRSLFVLGLLFLTGTAASLAQAGPTASRVADIQVGAGFTYANSDYAINKIRGYNIYGDIDLTEHWGAAFDFHQLNDPQPTKLYERSYEAGARYIRHYGRINPYAKLMYGRGVFNFPAVCRQKVTNARTRCDDPNVIPSTYVSAGNIAYNMFVGGGGVDVHITRRINARVDVEYQDWLSGPGLSGGLTPLLFTVGAAYHFPAGRPR